jgi:hypothetical protein
LEEGWPLDLRQPERYWIEPNDDTELTLLHATNTAPSASLASSTEQEQSRPYWLPYAETFTILLLAIASLWAVRPLLEEWGMFRAYNSAGLSYLATIFPLISMRPLHLTPSALQWLAGGGQVWGVGVVAAFMLVARYLVVRWAVTPVLSPVQRWAFATACTVLVGWPALWLARFHPAQLSATLFFVLLGLSIRLNIRNSLLPYIAGALSLCALLMVYQALALLVCAIPVIAYLWVPHGQSSDISARVYRSARSSVMVGGGFALYAIYAAAIYTVMDGVYEVAMAATARQTNPVMLLLGNIPTAYKATFERSPESLGLLMVLLCFAASELDKRRGEAYAVLGLLAALCLPLLSLVYISPGNLRDPERAMFPVACGAVVILLGLFILQRRKQSRNPQYIILVGALLASGAMSAQNARARWDFQEDIITQVTNLALATGAKRITIRDETGLLGDVYTFLDNVLTDAVATRGVEMQIKLCTPNGVDRIHPDAYRYPLTTTPRCAASTEQNAQTLEAVARMHESKVVIERAVPPTAQQ